VRLRPQKKNKRTSSELNTISLAFSLCGKVKCSALIGSNVGGYIASTPVYKNVKEFKMATAKSDQKKRKHSKSLDLTRHQRFEATRGPRNFRPEWQANFPWVEVEEKDGKEVMICSVCRRFPKFANKMSKFLTGCVNFKTTALKSHQTRHLKFHIDLYYCCHVLALL